MNIRWEITAADKARVRELLRTHANSPFVRERIARNVKGHRTAVTKSSCWHQMVACLLTTQQRSGPTSAVSRFIKEQPFPLSYRQCRKNPRVGAFVAKTITTFGGIRRAERIGSECADNIAILEKGLWTDLMARMKGLDNEGTSVMEREAARFVSDNLKGFGPKQSRNLLQSLGLTKYEIPLDSRVAKWLNQFGFPVVLSAVGLQDEHYYSLVLDGVQRLCRECKALPCVLDACIFVSFDKSKWKTGEVIW